MSWLDRNAMGLSYGLAGLGESLMALDQGQKANLQPMMAGLQQMGAQRRQQEAVQGIMESPIVTGMSPEQRGALSAIMEANPNAGLGILAQQAFPSPAEMTDQQRLFEMIAPENRQQAARVQLGLDPRAQSPKPEGPMSPLAKLTADFRAGRIDKDGYVAARKKILEGNNGISIGPDGSVQIGGPVRKLTEQQGKFTLFGSMMQSSMPVLNELEQRFDPANFTDHAADQFGWAGNYAKSDEYQRYKSAAGMWLEGVLRLATGAAATQPEIERLFATYFAQPGDSPEVIAFKRQQRDEAARAVGQASGGLVNPTGETGQQTPSGSAVSDMSDEQILQMLQERGLQ